MSENAAFDTLSDRIRGEAAQADRPGQMQRLEAIADEVDRLRRGAKTLGHVIEQQCRMALDATGLHHVIGEDGDGDWGAVWDGLFDIRTKALQEADNAVIAGAPPINSELREAVEALLDTCAQLAVRRPVGDRGDTRWGEGYKRAYEQVETELRALLAEASHGSTKKVL